MAKDTLIVTGLCGLIGSHLKSAFGDRYEMVPIDIQTGTDLTDPAQVEEVISGHADALAVIHLAAFTDVSSATEQEGDKSGLCYRLNVDGTQNVVDSCKTHGLHLVHVSTDFVFDGSKEDGYTEEDIPRPIEWYGETKYLAEEVVRSGLPDHTIMRIAFPYVPGQAAREDLVAKIRKRLEEGGEASLFEDQIITPTFAGDIVDALELLARNQPVGETFHVTGSTSLSPYQLGHAVAKVIGLDAAKVQASSMEEYLKKDPRPRQQFMKIDNRKYAAFAEGQGLSAPLEIEAGLEAIRKSLAG